MKQTVLIGTVAEDPASGEFILYLLEDTPWPDSDIEWEIRLRHIQNRILDAFDAAVDGGLAQKFPDSIGKRIRIQVDSPHGQPPELLDLVKKVVCFISSDSEYMNGLRRSKYALDVRVVTGHQLGRFNQI